MPQPVTDIIFEKDAHERIRAGVETLARAVGTTLGPRGRNVGIDRGYERVILHDGVTVARSINLPDPYERFAANTLREAAQRQVEAVGDGTTVTIVLAQAILSAAYDLIDKGTNAMSLRAGLEAGVAQLVEALRYMAIPVETIEQAISVAIISAEDETLGRMVGETVFNAGPQGIVTVDESKMAETMVELQEGMQFDRGYLSPYFVTDPARMEATVTDAAILLTDISVTAVEQLTPLLQQMEAAGMNKLVIIAPEIDGTAREMLVFTKTQGGAQTLAITAPGYGSYQLDYLHDIAVLTGGRVISQAAGESLDSATVNDLGHAGRVTSTAIATLIVDGRGEVDAITERIGSISAQLAAETQPFPTEKLKERIGRLSGKVAVIKVGGRTDIEMKERKERAIDAVAATKSAIRSGIVAGGETSYMDAASTFFDARPDTGVSKDAQDILIVASAEPYLRLLTNAGITPSLRPDKDTGLGIDVTDGVRKNLIEAGIIDPVEVPINALQNAASVAIQLMTTDAIIVNRPEEAKG